MVETPPAPFSTVILLLALAAVVDLGHSAIDIALPAAPGAAPPAEAALRAAAGGCALAALYALQRRRRAALPLVATWAALWTIHRALRAWAGAGAALAAGGVSPGRWALAATIVSVGLLVPALVLRTVWRRRAALA